MCVLCIFRCTYCIQSHLSEQERQPTSRTTLVMLAGLSSSFHLVLSLLFAHLSASSFSFFMLTHWLWNVSASFQERLKLQVEEMPGKICHLCLVTLHCKWNHFFNSHCIINTYCLCVYCISIVILTKLHECMHISLLSSANACIVVLPFSLFHCSREYSFPYKWAKLWPTICHITISLACCSWRRQCLVLRLCHGCIALPRCLCCVDGVALCTEMKLHMSCIHVSCFTLWNLMQALTKQRTVALCYLHCVWKCWCSSEGCIGKRAKVLHKWLFRLNSCIIFIKIDMKARCCLLRVFQDLVLAICTLCTKFVG